MFPGVFSGSAHLIKKHRKLKYYPRQKKSILTNENSLLFTNNCPNVILVEKCSIENIMRAIYNVKYNELTRSNIRSIKRSILSNIDFNDKKFMKSISHILVHNGTRALLKINTIYPKGKCVITFLV